MNNEIIKIISFILMLISFNSLAEVIPNSLYDNISSNLPYLKFDLSKGKIPNVDFYDNKELKGKPVFRLTEDGAFLGDKQVCKKVKRGIENREILLKISEETGKKEELCDSSGLFISSYSYGKDELWFFLNYSKIDKFLVSSYASTPIEKKLYYNIENLVNYIKTTGEVENRKLLQNLLIEHKSFSDYFNSLKNCINKRDEKCFIETAAGDEESRIKFKEILKTKYVLDAQKKMVPPWELLSKAFDASKVVVAFVVWQKNNCQENYCNGLPQLAVEWDYILKKSMGEDQWVIRVRIDGGEKNRFFLHTLDLDY